jgi:hypothetical protein
MYFKFKNYNIIEFYDQSRFKAGGCVTCPDGKIVNKDKTGCDTITFSESEERMYPPTRTLTSASHTILGESYGYGLYETWESTRYNTSSAGFSAFNTSDTEGYHGALYQYNHGAYTGNNFIVSDYKGDWVKIGLPKPIKLTRYRIYERPSNWTRAPSYFRIYGSNNNKEWTLLHDKIFFEYYSDAHTEGNVVSNEYYKYFALVVNKLIGYDSLESKRDAYALNFGAWYIYGKEQSE